jgi:hypothetical protein
MAPAPGGKSASSARGLVHSLVREPVGVAVLLAAHVLDGDLSDAARQRESLERLRQAAVHRITHRPLSLSTHCARHSRPAPGVPQEPPSVQTTIMRACRWRVRAVGARSTGCAGSSRTGAPARCANLVVHGGPYTDVAHGAEPVLRRGHREPLAAARDPFEHFQRLNRELCRERCPLCRERRADRRACDASRCSASRPAATSRSASVSPASAASSSAAISSAAIISSRSRSSSRAISWSATSISFWRAWNSRFVFTSIVWSRYLVRRVRMADRSRSINRRSFSFFALRSRARSTPRARSRAVRASAALRSGTVAISRRACSVSVSMRCRRMRRSRSGCMARRVAQAGAAFAAQTKKAPQMRSLWVCRIPAGRRVGTIHRGPLYHSVSPGPDA